MKKVLIVAVISLTALCSFGAQPTSTTEREKCVTTNASTNGVIVGGSTQTCVTTHADGSRTVKEKTCVTGGIGGSIGVAKGSATISDCTTTTTEYPAPSSSNKKSPYPSKGMYLVPNKK